MKPRPWRPHSHVSSSNWQLEDVDSQIQPAVASAASAATHLGREYGGCVGVAGDSVLGVAEAGLVVQYSASSELCTNSKSSRAT